ncbi:hypothetical protein [Neobacillus sp. SAB-20_R2A]|uniref:hypothetical protein n=1 Tax=Neobacillus sp. SAB-20_R2A TaxID=3120519 RepID=UPI003C6E75EE
MKILKHFFTGILMLGLIFSSFSAAFAAGGGGGGTGSGGGTDPVTFEGAYLTTITENVSTTGKSVNGYQYVGPNDMIKLVFNKNVVNSTVWDINQNAITMEDTDKNQVAINVDRIPDEGANSNPNEKRNIFISPKAPLTLGKTYTITIKSTLTANNTSTLGQKQTVTFTVKTDVTAPVLTVTEPADLTLTNQSKILVSGSTEAGSVVTINNTDVSVNAEGLFSQEITLLAGLNNIEITSTDAQDNQTVKVVKVTYDNAAPALVIASPADNFVSKTDKITVNGTSESGAVVKVNDTPVSLDSNNAFSQEVSLVKGANKITIAALDAAGNLAVTELHVTYDDSAPAVNGGVTKPVNNNGGTGTAAGHKLPDTATNMYTFLCAGILIVIFGLLVLAGPRIRRE